MLATRLVGPGIGRTRFDLGQFGLAGSRFRRLSGAAPEVRSVLHQVRQRYCCCRL
jgi:hypothetical protein